MSALIRVLYPLPAPRRTPGALLRWWESRRPAYNLAVGVAGLVSLTAVNLLSVLPPHPHPLGVPLIPIMVYAILANLCYSAGWVIETTLEMLWRDQVRPIGPVLFRQGLIFSVGLSLLPIVLAGLEWATRIVMAIFR
jgi:hypothetical protein